MRIGYTQGVFDMFHVGHLNLLNNARAQCDQLIVGVNSDALVESYKHKVPVVRQEFRRMIVENIKAVEKAYIVDTLEKVKILEQIPFDVIFIGDDWKGKFDFLKEYCEVVYLTRTPEISTTQIKAELKE